MPAKPAVQRAALATRALIAFVSILRCVLAWFCTTSERTVIKVE